VKYSQIGQGTPHARVMGDEVVGLLNDTYNCDGRFFLLEFGNDKLAAKAPCCFLKGFFSITQHP
jgi:hypothetical protein